MQYWFYGQLRRYREQIIRVFNSFYIDEGVDALGNQQLKKVPCRYGDASRLAASIIRANSENKILSTPFISVYMTGLNMAADRRQDPTFVGKLAVNERAYDSENQHYTGEIGPKYNVERYMPIPYDMTWQADIWTSNTNQKEQLAEQILVLFNPGIDFQTSVNPVDWTAINLMEMQDSINWSSRTIPVGTDNPIDVLSLSFKVPGWLNPPAKVTRQAIIQQIVTNIGQGFKENEAVEWTEYDLFSRLITTPKDARINVGFITKGQHAISLESNAGVTTDIENLPTIVTGNKVNPSFVPGNKLSINGTVITISGTSLTDVVNDIRNAFLPANNINAKIDAYNKLQIINNSGGDLDLLNILGTPLTTAGIIVGNHSGGKLAWWRLLDLYGPTKTYSEYGTNASQLRLVKSGDVSNRALDVVGWIDFDPLDQNQLIWYVDQQSLPQTTLSPINAVIDPHRQWPGNNLPSQQVGQRYLLLDKPSETSIAWGILDADINDIIQYGPTGWFVAFDASTSTGNQFVTNNFNGKLLEFDLTTWVDYLNQDYLPGFWRLSL